jgi:hypothetical protein
MDEARVVASGWRAVVLIVGLIVAAVLIGWWLSPARSHVEVPVIDCEAMWDTAETEADRALTLDACGDGDGIGEVDDWGERIEEDDPRWDCHTMGNQQCREEWNA